MSSAIFFFFFYFNTQILSALLNSEHTQVSRAQPASQIWPLFEISVDIRYPRTKTSASITFPQYAENTDTRTLLMFLLGALESHILYQVYFYYYCVKGPGTGCNQRFHLVPLSCRLGVHLSRCLMLLLGKINVCLFFFTTEFILNLLVVTYYVCRPHAPWWTCFCFFLIFQR